MWLLSCHRKAEPPAVNIYALNQQVGQHPSCSRGPQRGQSSCPQPPSAPTAEATINPSPLGSPGLQHFYN